MIHQNIVKHRCRRETLKRTEQARQTGARVGKEEGADISSLRRTGRDPQPRVATLSISKVELDRGMIVKDRLTQDRESQLSFLRIVQTSDQRSFPFRQNLIFRNRGPLQFLGPTIDQDSLAIQSLNQNPPLIA